MILILSYCSRNCDYIEYSSTISWEGDPPNLGSFDIGYISISKNDLQIFITLYNFMDVWIKFFNFIEHQKQTGFPISILRIDFNIMNDQTHYYFFTHPAWYHSKANISSPTSFATWWCAAARYWVTVIWRPNRSPLFDKTKLAVNVYHIAGKNCHHFQTSFSWLKFHWNVFPWIQPSIHQHWFRK